MSTTDYQRLLVNTGKTNPPDVWSTLATCTLTLAEAGKILAIFTASGLNSGALGGGYNTYFRLRLDGVAQDCGAIGSTTIAGTSTAWCAGSSTLLDASAGAHTIDLQWNADPGTYTINASASIFGSPPSPEHAALYVEVLPSTGPGTLASETAPVLVELASNKTANADWTTFTSLVSGSITTLGASSRLLIHVDASVHVTAQCTPWLRLKVDGSLVLAAFCSRRANYLANIPIVYAPVVGAGVHTVDVEWVADAGGVECNPVALPEVYSAKIYMQEKAL